MLLSDPQINSTSNTQVNEDDPINKEKADMLEAHIILSARCPIDYFVCVMALESLL